MQSLFQAGTTSSGADSPFGVLGAVLRSVAPELLDCPEVISQMMAYLGLNESAMKSRPSSRQLLTLLKQHLKPPIKDKGDHLLIALDGMKAIMQENGLHSAQALDEFMARKKREFGELMFSSHDEVTNL